MSEHVKIYTVNGAPAGSSVALPDWLARARAVKGKGAKKATKDRIDSSLELIQGFEFPEASLRVKTTRDGGHIIATGTYKPQMRVWDVGQLSQKFERHSDAENVDFVILSDDWTKVLMLQNDRSIEVHTQGGLHHRTRIPKFGRAVNYHFPSCTALFGTAGNEIYRLSLDQGRFLSPLRLGDEIEGVNAVDVNPAHGLLALGTDGAGGGITFIDPRSRSSVGVLPLPASRLINSSGTSFIAAPVLPGLEDAASPLSGLSVSSLSSRSDGLSYAVGTSSGHTLLYDVRSRRPFAVKDQGYGLPIKRVSWVEGGSRMAGDGLVISADKKVVKIWDRNSPGTNFASLTPASDLNDIHHIPGSGLLLSANEGIQMGAYFVPQLGPAPRWASFLENMTEELEDGGSAARGVYEDFKFVSREELTQLGLDNLIGTPALKPYMHGFFISLGLYDTARVIANPFVYEEARAKAVQRKLDAQAEARIRAPKNAPKPKVKVNKALAEKVVRDAEKEREKEEKKRARRAGKVDPSADVDPDAMEVDAEAGDQPSLLTDSRFSALFEDPEFEVNERSREYALLHPSAVAMKKRATQREESSGSEDEEDASAEDVDDVGIDGGVDGERRTKTAVEEEEEESEKAHSDTSDDDSSDAGELYPADYKARQRGQPNERVKFVPLRTQGPSTSTRTQDAPFGQRRAQSQSQKSSKKGADDQHIVRNADGTVEMSWVPSSGGGGKGKRRSSGYDEDDGMDGGKGKGRGKGKERDTRKGLERFGAGMEKGGEDQGRLSESERKGRTSRRRDVRSGSKNTFRKI
ncbi:hypothetical protein PENSPDRAFT_603451 [Peniophora sp. CONT]|nr:hypothetical protein PENSPDRAFT_603451 [Peniophora sp. CONT]